MTARSALVAADSGLADAIERRSGLRLGGTRLAPSQAAIQWGMTSAGATDAEEYLRLLDRDPAAFDALVGGLTVGETYFFRERTHFELLRRVILPEVRSRRGAKWAVRAWSAGCSTGEEAYSLAMVFARSGVEGRVLGTDLSRKNLTKAKRGVYGPWSLRGVERGELDGFLEPTGAGFRVRASVAEGVVFALGNLIAGPPGRGRFDVVFCRNVLIYLTPDGIRSAVNTLIETLAVGGWLVTASSDPHLVEDDRLERVRTEFGIAYRRRGRREGDLRSADHDGRDRRAAMTVPAPRAMDGRHAGERVTPADPVLESTARSGSAEHVRDAPAEGNDTVEAVADLIRAVADVGRTADALSAAETGVRAHPMSAELHYLRALLLLAMGRPADAVAAADTALYLDSRLVVAHVLRATADRRIGNAHSVARSLRNARRLLSSLPPDAPVRCGDGERADLLLAAVDAQLGAAAVDRP